VIIMDNAARSPKAQAEEKKRLAHHVSDFLRKYRVVLLGVLAAVVLAIIAIAVWTAVNSAGLKASTAAIEKVEDELQAWQAEQDTAKKAELEKGLTASLDSVIAKWPRRLAGQRALAFKAKIAEERKDWAAAEKEWLAAVDALPDSYLAAVALQGAAAAADERGAPEKAAEHYKRLLAKYAKSAVGIPHAHFALGRLAEESKDYAAALTSYEKVVTAYPDDDWTKLAKDRIISLKSRGLVK
jgi:tetratricopeptide (TPR) repeat protein